MKKILITSISSLLITVSGSTFAAGLDAQSLSNSMDSANATASSKSGFAIVYGGQDISRGSINLHDAKVYQPILIG